MSKIIGFLKFVLPEFNADFVDGKLFMQSLEFYKDENITDKLISDAYEGLIPKEKDPKNTLIYVARESDENAHLLPNISEIRYTLWHNAITDIKINCLTIITLDDVEESGDGFYKLKESYINSSAEYTDKRIIHVTLNPEQFIDTIQTRLEQESIPYKSGNVYYYGDEHPLYGKITNITKAIETVFYKKNKYCSQREYRIAVETYNDDFIRFERYTDFWQQCESLESIKIKRH